jgi:hypothetical protein
MCPFVFYFKVAQPDESCVGSAGEGLFEFRCVDAFRHVAVTTLDERSSWLHEILGSVDAREVFRTPNPEITSPTLTRNAGNAVTDQPAVNSDLPAFDQGQPA